MAYARELITVEKILMPELFVVRGFSFSGRMEGVFTKDIYNMKKKGGGGLNHRVART